MNTSQSFCECLECKELFFLHEKEDGFVLSQPGSRKKHDYHDSMFCPLCHKGRLLETSFDRLHAMRLDQKHELAHLRVLKDDYAVMIHSLRKKTGQQQETISRLQSQLDAARQMRFRRQVLCGCGCGEVVKQPKAGRKRAYINDTHKKCAYRKRVSVSTK